MIQQLSVQPICRDAPSSKYSTRIDRRDHELVTTLDAVETISELPRKERVATGSSRYPVPIFAITVEQVTCSLPLFIFPVVYTS